MELWIDGLTPCLLDAKTGLLVDTSFSRVSQESLYGLHGWGFDWSDPALEQDEVYKLTLAKDRTIQGLVALRTMERDRAVYVHIAESAPHNLGPDKAFRGVGGHLFAIAALRSLHSGYGGFFFMDAKNLELVRHYQSVLGAVWLGIPHEFRMLVEEDAALRLVEQYTLEEDRYE